MLCPRISASLVSRTQAKDPDGKLRKVTIIVSIVFIIVCIALNVLALAFGM